MQTVRHSKSVLGATGVGLLLAVLTLAGPLCLSAEAQQTPEQAEEAAKKAREEAGKRAERAYGVAMKLNTNVAVAIGVIRGIITQDPMTVIEALVDLLGGGGADGPADITVEQARDEIIGELRSLREDELAFSADGLLRTFGEIIRNRDNPAFEFDLNTFNIDAGKLFDQLYGTMLDDDPARAMMAYNLAPAFNTVVSLKLVALKMQGKDQKSVDDILLAAINANTRLVADGSRYEGYLYRAVQKEAGYWGCNLGYWVNPATGVTEPIGNIVEMDLVDGWVNVDTAGRTIELPFDVADCESPEAGLQLRLRYDSDPIVYLIRNAVTEQQLALLP